MGLREGAETVIRQCLDVGEGEEVLVLNDGNDEDLIDALLEVLEDSGLEHKLLEYPEPETHGSEPPEEVAEAMKEADAVIAPTLKSISHTEARREACENGARVASMPRIDREVWNSSLQADYNEVEKVTCRVYELLADTEEVRVETPSGTDLSFRMDIDTFHRSDGKIDQPGDFSNLPDGEPNGFPVDIEGVLVIDHFPFSPETQKVEIRKGRAVALENKEGAGTSELQEKFDEMPCSRRIAEFGFGTNPEATLIGNVLQDEKVLGTVHFAFGDNTSYLPEGHDDRNPAVFTGTPYARILPSGSTIGRFWIEVNRSSSRKI